MRTNHHLARIASAWLLGWSVALAGPTTQPAAPAQLTATVAEVAGLVELRSAEDQPWREAAVGMTIPVGGECRTGPKSHIILTLPPSQVIKLDRLGTVQILEAFQKGNTVKTDLGMKYGRVRYHEEAAGLEQESVIRSPSSALAVRGSDVEKTDYAFISEVRVYKGVAERRDSNRTVVLGTGKEDAYGDRPVELTEGASAPAEHAADLAAVPYADALLLAEQERAAVIHTNNAAVTVAGVQSVQSFQVPPTVAPQFPTALGTLVFDLQWTATGTPGVVPDLSLFVITPRNEKVQVDVTKPIDGVIGTSLVGGESRASGREKLTWSSKFPLGQYVYGVKYEGKGDPASFKIRVLRDGKPISAEFIDVVHESDSLVTFTIRVDPKQAAAAKKAAVQRAAAPRPDRPAPRLPRALGRK